MKRRLIRLCLWRRPPLIPFPSTYIHTYNMGTPGGFSKATAVPSPGLHDGVLRPGLAFHMRNEKAGDQAVWKRQQTGKPQAAAGLGVGKYS